MFHDFIEFSILLCTFLVTSLTYFFSTFSDVLPAFTCARAISSICLGVNIFSPSPYFALCLASDAIEK